MMSTMTKNASNQSGGWWSRRKKAVVAVVGAGVAWSYVVIGGPSHISADEWRQGFILMATALGVYITPNR